MKSLLDSLGWSQAFFAEKMDVSPRTVGRWVKTEKGSGYGPAMTYLKLVSGWLTKVGEC